MRKKLMNHLRIKPSKLSYRKTQKTKMKNHDVMKISFLVRVRLPVTGGSHTRRKLDKRSDEVRLRFSHRGAHRPQNITSVKQQLVMWANATISTTDLGNMSFLDFVVGIVNTGWPRPLAKSRTSRNPGVWVWENVSLETPFSKHRALCQRAIRCTSTWRSCSDSTRPT